MPAKKKSKTPNLELKCENGWNTVSAAERDAAVAGTYSDEGIACHVWTSP